MLKKVEFKDLEEGKKFWFEDENGDLKLVENIENFDEYKDKKLYMFEEYEDVVQELTYRCNYCHNPDYVFDDLEYAKKHAENCLMNPAAKRCTLCKHLKIVENAPYPRNIIKWQTHDMYTAFGGYKQPYCMKFDKKITDEVAYENHDDCFELSYDTPVIEQTEEFKEYWDLVQQHGEETKDKKVS